LGGDVFWRLHDIEPYGILGALVNALTTARAFFSNNLVLHLPGADRLDHLNGVEHKAFSAGLTAAAFILVDRGPEPAPGGTIQVIVFVSINRWVDRRQQQSLQQLQVSLLDGSVKGGTSQRPQMRTVHPELLCKYNVLDSATAPSW
jgi:hypothetical protein